MRSLLVLFFNYLFLFFRVVSQDGNGSLFSAEELYSGSIGNPTSGPSCFLINWSQFVNGNKKCSSALWPSFWDMLFLFAFSCWYDRASAFRFILMFFCPLCLTKDDMKLKCCVSFWPHLAPRDIGFCCQLFLPFSEITRLILFTWINWLSYNFYSSRCFLWSTCFMPAFHGMQQVEQ